MSIAYCPDSNLRVLGGSDCGQSSQDVTSRAQGRGLDEREDEGDPGPRQHLLRVREEV